jgi:hypothetical protein
MSHADLIQTYIAALNLTAVTVIGDGRQCRIHTGEIPPGERVKAQFFFRPTHAELVLMTVNKEGLAGKAAGRAGWRDRAGGNKLGAPYQTPDGLRKAAERHVDEIVTRVKDARMDGELREINKRYRQYRLAQVARAERAMPYSAYIQHFTASLVRDAAATGRMI